MRGGNPINLIKNRVLINLRPNIIASRRSFGDWEFDGMGFKGNHHFVLVAHERKSRFIAAFRQPNRTAATTAETLISLFKTLPKAMARSSTFDNGSEFYHHQKLNQECNMATYFCDTHSPWQKGVIENTNGRLRRCLPTKLNPNELSQHAFDVIIANHNNTPRKCLGFKIPAELFNQKLNLLHFNRESAPPAFAGMTALVRVAIRASAPPQPHPANPPPHKIAPYLLAPLHARDSRSFRRARRHQHLRRRSSARRRSGWSFRPSAFGV